MFRSTVYRLLENTFVNPLLFSLAWTDHQFPMLDKHPINFPKKVCPLICHKNLFWGLNNKIGQWIETLYENWNFAVLNTFDHSIKIQPPHQSLFHLQATITIKKTVTNIKWLRLSSQLQPQKGRATAKQYVKNRTRRRNSDVPRFKYKFIVLFHILTLCQIIEHL